MQEHGPRIAILGAGGVGGYFGGLLARSGMDVTFIARGAHLAAIRDSGLSVKSVHGDIDVRPASATDQPAELGPVDLVIVSVKTYDLEEAALSALPLIGPSTVALPLLNGLDAVERLAPLWGEDCLLAGLTHVSSRIAAPGVIHQTSAVQRITLGEHDGSLTPRADRVRGLLAAGGVDAVLSPSVTVALWEKFIFIASISGVCCLARQPMGSVLACRETRQLYHDALREVEEVGLARGVDLPPGVVGRTQALTEGFDPDTKPSLLAALEAGQRLELEAMSGTVVRYGAGADVPTPIHGVIYASLKPSIDGITERPSLG